MCESALYHWMMNHYFISIDQLESCKSTHHNFGKKEEIKEEIIHSLNFSTFPRKPFINDKKYYRI